MERASKLLRSIGLPADTMSPQELACAAWAAAVGKKIAAHTRAARLVRTRLVVEVEDAVWQRQLFALTPHILRNLDKSLGSGLVEDLEFRIVIRARASRRARHGGSRRAVLRRGRRHRRSRPARHLPGFPKKGAGVKITEKEVRYVADLANLNLTDAEVVRFRTISTVSSSTWTS